MTMLIEEAEDLLLHQFANSKKLKGLIRVLVTSAQQAYSELEKLHQALYIEGATGESLDVIGAIVGQPRGSMSDDDYRPWLKVAIYLNNSVGTAEDIIAILSILYQNRPAIRQIEERTPNVVEFTLHYPPFSEQTIKAIIVRAVPIGTNCKVKFDLPPDAAPTSVPATDEINAPGSNSIERLSPFQFDVTRFDESYFLDFS